MPLSVPRMLIFDDKEEDGIKIAKSIWDSKYSVRFIRYDPESFLQRGKENIKGVRIIFMDIDLIGDGVFGSGSKNFSAVQQALEYCLDERNGPYVLITWSTYDQHAEELFHHLKERMPINRRPVLCKRLNKEDYKNGSGNLTDKIGEYLNSLEATGCLIEWEKSIQYAVCETICKLMDIASGFTKDTNDALKSIFYTLAEAEAEQNLEKNNALRHLYSIFSQLLYDEAASSLPEDEEAFGEFIYSGKGIEREGQWHQRINSMLHLDFTEPSPGGGHMPGDVFKYPEQGHALPIPDEDINKFLRGRFMSLTSEEDTDTFKTEIEKACQLLLVEITPPCDYSQKKFVWHRYLIAALIPEKFARLVCVLNRKENKRDEGRLPDFCWSSPEFQREGLPPFSIIFNSRLIVSIPPKGEYHQKLGKRLFRIRQPLLSDMIGWLTRQSARLGHVSVS